MGCVRRDAKGVGGGKEEQERGLTWKATKMVKMYARGRSESVNTNTPITQVIPMTTTRDTDTFIQCLWY